MISFDGVKVGDRVRLTRTVTLDGGEEFEASAVFIAAGCYGTQIDSDTNTFLESSWDTVEVLSPPKPPLPTVPGLYVSREGWVLNDANLYVLNAEGWSTDASGSWGDAFGDLPADLVRLVPEVQGDAKLPQNSGLLDAAREARNWLRGNRGDLAAGVLSDAIEKAEAQS